jgi:hypothetical protein
MAKLSSHGSIIGTVYFTSSAKRYMSDGTVLKNSGFGWKLGPKLKAGVTPETAFENQKAHQQAFLADRPMLQAYRKELHDMAGINMRWKLHQCISMMPDDCDGVWSECCDGYGKNISADVDEVAQLCRLYQLATEENARMKVTA